MSKKSDKKFLIGIVMVVYSFYISCTIRTTKWEIGIWEFVDADNGYDAFYYDIEFLEDGTFIIDSPFLLVNSFEYQILDDNRIKLSAGAISEIINYSFEGNFLYFKFNGGYNRYIKANHGNSQDFDKGNEQFQDSQPQNYEYVELPTITEDQEIPFFIIDGCIFDIFPVSMVRYKSNVPGIENLIVYFGVEIINYSPDENECDFRIHDTQSLQLDDGSIFSKPAVLFSTENYTYQFEEKAFYGPLIEVPEGFKYWSQLGLYSYKYDNFVSFRIGEGIVPQSISIFDKKYSLEDISIVDYTNDESIFIDSDNDILGVLNDAIFSMPIDLKIAEIPYRLIVDDVEIVFKNFRKEENIINPKEGLLNLDVTYKNLSGGYEKDLRLINDFWIIGKGFLRINNYYEIYSDRCQGFLLGPNRTCTIVYPFDIYENDGDLLLLFITQQGGINKELHLLDLSSLEPAGVDRLNSCEWDLSGSWSGYFLDGDNKIRYAMDLTQSGCEVLGTSISQMQYSEAISDITGVIENDRFSFSESGRLEACYFVASLKIEENRLSGKTKNCGSLRVELIRE